MSDNQTCTYRTLTDRDGSPYIASQGCEMHGQWLPDVYRTALEKSTVKPGQPDKKQRGRKPRFAAITGGQR